MGQHTIALQPMWTAERVAHLFKYHSPKLEQIPVYEANRLAMRRAVTEIVSRLPDCPQTDLYVSLCSQAWMQANAAIALYWQEGRPDEARIKERYDPYVDYKTEFTFAEPPRHNEEAQAT